MPYKDPEVAKVKARERKRRWREGHRSEDWVDGRGKHGRQVRTSAHPRWNGGMTTDESGYFKIQVGIEHPLADPNGYAMLHHLVFFSAIGANSAPLAPGEVIHHDDEDKQNNRWMNLFRMGRGAHNSWHNSTRARDAKGRFLGKKAAGHLLDGREHREFPA